MNRISGAGSRVAFGLVLVGVGALLFLSAFHVLRWWHVLRTYWPMVIVLVGLWQWVNRGFRLSFWPLFLVFLGLFLQALMLHKVHAGGLALTLGFVLIAFGLWVMLRKVGVTTRETRAEQSLDLWVVLGGVEQALTSQQFAGGFTTVIFGGVDLDLRGAALKEGDVRLALTVILGAIDIKVPEGWEVVVDSNAFLGGVEDQARGIRSGETRSGSRLIIRATAILGGIEVSR